MSERSDEEDARALADLVVQAALSVTDVVESMHHTIAGGPSLLGRPLAQPVRLLAAPSYAGVRLTTRLAGLVADRVLSSLALLPARMPGPGRLAVISALNGILGDRLADASNPLALPMTLCRGGAQLSVGEARAAIGSRRVAVLVHGSSANDTQWRRHDHDHGAMLESELGLTALYLRYNSGLHIGANGRALARLLDELLSHPDTADTELILIGHSMGGLVARSACAVAEQVDMRWRTQLSHLISLGSPHHGAPLERAGSWLQYLLGISAYSAPLGTLAKIRGAGITDLRYGELQAVTSSGDSRFEPKSDTRAPIPLPNDVSCHAVAATASEEPSSQLRSDGLVPVASALGMHSDPARSLAFPGDHCLVVYGTSHLGLLSSPVVGTKLVEWLAPGEATGPR